jgi:hypothetical protein
VTPKGKSAQSLVQQLISRASERAPQEDETATPVQGPVEGDTGSPEALAPEGMAEEIVAKVVTWERIQEEIEAFKAALAEQYEAQSYADFLELIQKWREGDRIKGQVLKQLEEYRSKVEEMSALGYTPAPLPFPLPDETPEMANVYGNDVLARIRENRMINLNTKASPIIREVLADLLTLVRKRAQVKMHGLQQDLIALGILQLHVACQNMTDGEWDSVSPTANRRSSPEVRFNELALILMRKIAAKPTGVAADADREAAAGGESPA